MDRFATLEPVKLYATGKSPAKLIGRLPADLHFLLIANLPIPDIPAYARCSRATAALVRNDSAWEERLKALSVHNDMAFRKVLDYLEQKANEQVTKSRAAAPATIAVDDDFVGTLSNATIPIASSAISATPAKDSYKAKFIRAFNLLRPVTRNLSSAPHAVLSDLSAKISSSLFLQAKLLRLLAYFLSSTIKPVRQWESLYASLRTCMDRYDSSLLAAFDVADGKADEITMREAAESSWEVWDRTSGDWEMGKVWTEKREIFYQQGKWAALDNFTKEQQLDFRAMDDFMDDLIAAMNDHGARAVRIFPPASHVVLYFSERITNEVLSEYISTLLSHAREISITTYLKAVPASFREAWRMVGTIMEVVKQRPDSNVSKTAIEDIVYRMFEQNMDEYLDEEVADVKRAFDRICKTWDQQSTSLSSPQAYATTQFLASQNPAQVKRNVLASFTSVLLLPVTIVPKTVGAVGGALVTGGTAAVQGIAMLNPQRWVGGNSSVAAGNDIPYTRNLVGTINKMEIEEEEEEKGDQVSTSKNQTPQHRPTADTTHQLDLLLSLDVALELIHADREALKRIETFAGYPGHYGHQVQDTIEEIFVLMLDALGDRHISPAFAQATKRMQTYKPAEHAETSEVAPLVQFFELAHLGDTIQSMVQVYFDKTLACYIDRTDFLNAAVREKKKFENSLDNSVAVGLNAGTELLMHQVEHIIITLTKAREYYPPEDAPLDLKPTSGCVEAIHCLEKHCKLLKGSTSKEVLEVFYQEIGLRLIGILQKHIKRQIISLSGGFQIISDLNAYNAFISSLKIPTLTADFSNLRMLGHVYIVEDARDLAQIVRDVTRYGGAYRPEDIYEFIQRRSDWKKIEKTVDKTMYNLSFKEDCSIC